MCVFVHAFVHVCRMPSSSHSVPITSSSSSHPRSLPLTYTPPPSLCNVQSMVINTDVEVRYESTLNQNGAANLEDACRAASERSEMLMELGFETQLGYEVVTVCFFWGGGMCVCMRVPAALGL